MNAPEQIGTNPATPEQLLQMLDIELGQQRRKRENRARKRAVILVFGILGILFVGGGALFVAQEMLLDLHERTGAVRASQAKAE